MCAMNITEEEQPKYDFLRTQPTWIRNQRINKVATICAIRDNFHCRYCGRDLLESYESYSLMQIDHLLPQSRKDIRPEGFIIDSPENIATVCSICHAKRTYHKNPIPPNWTPSDNRKENIKAIKEIVNNLENRKKSFEEIYNYFRK